MPRFYFETTLQVTSQAPQVALINPAASGVTLTLRFVRFFGGPIVAMDVERYSVEAALVPLGPPAPIPQAFDNPAAVSLVTVATVESHDITEPAPATKTFSISVYDDTAGQQLPLPDSIVIPAGSSLLIDTSESFNGTGPTFTFQIEYEEA